MAQKTPPVETYRPTLLSGSELDKKLACGWFRSSNGLSRSRFLCMSGVLCTPVNIRLKVNDVYDSKRIRRLRSKNEKFRVEMGRLRVCDEMEELYLKTSERFSGYIHEDLYGFLYDFIDTGMFDSYHLKVYDGNKLIAASVLDLGENSVMSVIGVYDPEYKQYSLGHYTMLLETELARKNGFTYYYPGYIMHEVPDFDYKLAIGDYQFLTNKHRWTKDYDKAVAGLPARSLQDAFNQLEQVLIQYRRGFDKWVYRYFSMGYSEPGISYFKEPMVYITVRIEGEESLEGWTYDYMEQCWKNECYSYEVDPYITGVEADELNKENYYEHILHKHYTMGTYKTIEEIKLHFEEEDREWDEYEREMNNFSTNDEAPQSKNPEE